MIRTSIGFVMVWLLIVPPSWAKVMDEGTIEINGTAGMSFSFGDAQSNNLELVLTPLYYIKPNVGVGLHWHYDRSTAGSTETVTHLLGPAAAYSKHLNEQANVKVIGSLNLASRQSSGSTEGGFAWQVDGQYNHFVTDRMSVNGGVQLQGQSYDHTNDTTLSTMVGVSFYFSKTSPAMKKHSVSTTSPLQRENDADSATRRLHLDPPALPKAPSMPRWRP